MNPDQVVAKLRQIATTIEGSKSPRRDLVTDDIKIIVAALGNMSKAFYWDEVEGVVHEIEAEIPDGSTARQCLVLFDDALTEQTGMGTYNKKIRQVGDVFVLDALFGRDKVTRIYYSPEGSEEDSKAAAEQELAGSVS